ncbi:MAG TPA: Crp/Fnr family transcriptional regulator [Tianweitania sediminis]|nr:Crp/Fnr family transcriptional regulator [Tianweitania sediminis]
MTLSTDTAPTGSTVALLTVHPLLRTLSLHTTKALLGRAIIRRLAHGELWISRSERANGIAIIVEGGLRSTTFTPDGKEYVFSIMKNGDIWGLVSTIDGIDNANDVYAHGDTTILTVDRRTTLSTMEAHPDFRQCLTQILCHRLRMANKVLEDRALQPIEVRLVRLLLSLRGSAAVGGPDKINVTQEMLAKILGCTRPTVNKKLQELERDEMLVASYGCIQIMNLSRMMRLSGQSEYFYF